MTDEERARHDEMMRNVGKLQPPAPKGVLDGYSHKFEQEFKTAFGSAAHAKDLPFL
jgi:hypothetical protein